MKQIWKKIFEDTLFEGKMPSAESKKKMYDKCYRKCKRKLRKELSRNPTKEELYNALFDCLTDELYRFQLEVEEARKDVGTDFERTGREREELELMQDVRSLNRLNRDFWGEGETEEDREKQRKKDKEWIEKKVMRESGYEETS